MRDKLMDDRQGTTQDNIVYPKPESSWGQRLDKRTTILQAASMCFLHKGYAETSLDEIVTQSGVVKQTIYNYFENKDALFRASLEYMMSGNRVVFDQSLYKLPPQEFFQRVGKELLGILSEIKTTAFLRLLVKEC